MEKKDLNMRVKALTTLTKDHEIPVLATSFFDSERPLPAVYALSSFVRFLLSDHYFSYNFQLVFLRGSPIPCF
jgi:hypothetical protein